MIHVAYRLWGGDGFYAKMCGTSMLSMFENTKEKVTVHIMHNERLTPDNRGKFCYIAGQYNQRVEFHNVEEIAGASLRKFEAAHPRGSQVNASWYPLIVHDVFPDLDKLIIIGADTVINLDIAELWAYDLGEYGFGAVSEYTNKHIWPAPLCQAGYATIEEYFNADLFLMKPKFFQENFERILEACKFVHDKNFPWREQDALNYSFQGNYLHLPKKFNTLVYCLRSIDSYFKIDKCIYHYVGGAKGKPSLSTDDVYYKLYLEYFLKTPWATVDMFGNLNKSFRRRYDLLKQQFLHYTNFIGKRERVFLLNKTNTDKMRRIFEIKDDELVVDVSDLEARAKFLETANELKGKYLIYVLADYEAVMPELRKRNLFDGKDFIDARIFLSEKDGGKFLVYDPRAVLREM